MLVSRQNQDTITFLLGVFTMAIGILTLILLELMIEQGHAVEYPLWFYHLAATLGIAFFVYELRGLLERKYPGKF